MDADVLTADGVRERLFDALRPITAGVLTTSANPDQDLLGLRILVRPYPLAGETPGARVFVVIEQAADVVEPRTQGLVASMANHAAVEAAVGDVLAVALAALGAEAAEAAEAAITAAERRAAVLLVQARPVDGSVRVVFVPKGGRPLVLGALTDAPVTTH